MGFTYKFAVIVLAITAAAAPRAGAAIPGGTNPKAYTQHDYLRGKLNFDKRTLTGAYNTVGLRDPQWDAPARAFLDGMAVHFTYGPADAIYRTVEPPTPEQLLALAKAATDAGCADPLVSYCRAALLHDRRDFKEARPLLERALAGLVERKYPPVRVAAAAERLARLLRESGQPNNPKYAATSRDAAIEAMSGKVDAKDLRYVLEMRLPLFNAATVAEQLAFCQALEASKDANPWCVELLRGIYEVKAAWAVRGGGWANQVGEDQWKGFYAHLALARDHLVKAHAAHPEFPEAATEMIPVAMGAGRELNESTRDWFDRAAAAQFDHYPAYQSYVWSIYPRWGGSHREMIAFGMECAATGRYDTYVPFRLLKIAEAVNDDGKRDFAVFADRAVHPALRTMLEQMAENGPPSKRDYYASYHAALAWRIGFYEEAAEVLGKLGARLDESQFATFGAWPPEAVSQIWAMNTPHAEALRRARTEAREGDVAAAIITLSNVASKLPKDHKGLYFVRHRARLLEIGEDLAQGKSVALGGEDDFLPWARLGGTWKVDEDGAIVATSRAAPEQTMMLLRVPVGNDFEIKATAEPADAKSGAGPLVYVGAANPQQVRPIGVYAPTRQLFVPGDPGVIRLPQDMNVDGPKALVITVNAGQISVSVDGKELVTRRPYKTETAGPYIGLGMGGGRPGAQVRFRDIELKRLPPPDEK